MREKEPGAIGLRCWRRFEPTHDGANPWVTVFLDRVRFPNGKEGFYNRIVEVGGRKGVAILPLRDGAIGLVRLYRYPIGRGMWEIPRGFGKSTRPRQDMIAEMMEETGLAVATSESLGIIYPNSGLLSNSVEIFGVTVKSAVSDDHVRDSEVSEFQWIPVNVVLEMIRSCEITDSFTMCAILRAQVQGLLPRELPEHGVNLSCDLLDAVSEVVAGTRK